MQSSLFKKLMTPHYYTATVDHPAIPGTEIVRSSSLRQVMRFAARFNNTAPDAEIYVFRHVNGHDPKLVARRMVTQRFWRYTERLPKIISRGVSGEGPVVACPPMSTTGPLLEADEKSNEKI
jgi:hypothetical protein